MKQFGALRGVTSAVARFDARRQEQSISKNGRLIRFARPGGVFDDDDFVIRNLAGEHLWIDRRRRNPKATLRVKVHLRRLVDERIFGP